MIRFKDPVKGFCRIFESYHLKTVFYRTLEKTDPSFWSEINIVECFDMLFDELIYAVEHELCLHYWLPEINLLRNAGYYHENDLKTLKEARKKPKDYIQSDVLEKVLNQENVIINL